MSNIRAKSYFHYQDYLLNGHKINYNYLVEGEMQFCYMQLYAALEARELRFYNSKFKKYNVAPPDDWKEELEAYLSTAGLTPKRANEIAAMTFSDSNTLDEFQNILINNIQEELDVKEDFNKTIERVVGGLYKDLLTRYQNETIELKHRQKTGQLFIKGSNIKTIEGWMIEIAQGVVSPNKQSTSDINSLKFVADYIVPDIGLEEVKRGIKDDGRGNKLLDSNFHIGSFTANTKRNIPKYLSDALARCVTDIVVGITKTNSKKLEDAKKIFFQELTWLIYPYLCDRLLNHTNNGEIFYFSSGSKIILASDFVGAIIGLNKMYIDGSTGNSKATIESGISLKWLEKMGIHVDPKAMNISHVQLGLNLDNKAKDELEYKLNTNYKNGAFLTYAKFDLWYGKKR